MSKVVVTRPHLEFVHTEEGLLRIAIPVTKLVEDGYVWADLDKDDAYQVAQHLLSFISGRLD